MNEDTNSTPDQPQSPPPGVKQQLIEQLGKANNVLVTVSKDPTVDQLSAAMGLSLFLNKLGKHTTVVFSGKTPSTIEFLKPEESIERTTDSLRDFIIALDKSKADKLRYKVEDKHVKIFITPYRTTLKAKDLEFSQGDFNVDTVVALGVHQQTDLDDAIVTHGQILHNATVITINTTEGQAMGNISLTEIGASSLCELIVELCQSLKEDSFDAQNATALLTGIVAETDRFSNAKTKPSTMALASKLMAAGANQQLVASELHVPEPEPEKEVSAKPDKTPSEASKKDSKAEEPKETADAGLLSVEHNDKESAAQTASTDAEQKDEDEISIDSLGTISKVGEDQSDDQPASTKEPPLAPAGAAPDDDNPASATPPPPPSTGRKILPPRSQKVSDHSADPTLESLERSVDSPHLKSTSGSVKPKQPGSADHKTLPPPVPPPIQ